MPKTKKDVVFEDLFFYRYDVEGERYPRWDEATQTIPEEHRLVYSHEVKWSIEKRRVALGPNQSANFAKDFLRKASRSSNWPKSIAQKRWTMNQMTGKDPVNNLARNFIFKPYEPGQEDPFPDEWPIPRDVARHDIQSVTLSVAAKQIARLDEPRLMQITVDLRVVETHFALYSPLSTDAFKIVHMDHLQMGLKLRGSEVDGLYLAQFQDETGGLHPVLITVEAKKHDEFVNSSQVISQVEAASGLGVTAELIVPIALKHANGGMHIFEYAPFTPPTGNGFERDSLGVESLERVATIFYRIKPDVVGLSLSVRRPKTPKKTNGQMTFIETAPAADLVADDDDDDDGDDE